MTRIILTTHGETYGNTYSCGRTCVCEQEFYLLSRMMAHRIDRLTSMGNISSILMLGWIVWCRTIVTFNFIWFLLLRIVSRSRCSYFALRCQIDDAPCSHFRLPQINTNSNIWCCYAHVWYTRNGAFYLFYQMHESQSHTHATDTVPFWPKRTQFTCAYFLVSTIFYMRPIVSNFVLFIFVILLCQTITMRSCELLSDKVK